MAANWSRAPAASPSPMGEPGAVAGSLCRSDGVQHRCGVHRRVLGLECFASTPGRARAGTARRLCAIA